MIVTFGHVPRSPKSGNKRTGYGVNVPRMSRRASDYAKCRKPVLVVNWTDSSAFHLNRLGYRLILTKDWSLYAVKDGLMYVYDTEEWREWLVRLDSNLDEMFIYSDRYDPRPLLNKFTRTHVTLEVFLRKLQSTTSRKQLFLRRADDEDSHCRRMTASSTSKANAMGKGASLQSSRLCLS